MCKLFITQKANYVNNLCGIFFSMSNDIQTFAIRLKGIFVCVKCQ
jgi:hypothetical protein